MDSKKLRSSNRETKNSFAQLPVWLWILIYVIVAVIIYLLIYVFWLRHTVSSTRINIRGGY